MVPKKVKSLNVTFSKPVEGFKYRGFDYAYRLFDNYKERSLLPFPGTVSEQPAKIIEIFEIFNQLQHERETRTRDNK